MSKTTSIGLSVLEPKTVISYEQMWSFAEREIFFNILVIARTARIFSLW